MREIWRTSDDGKMNETLFLQSTSQGLGGNLFVGICLVFPIRIARRNQSFFLALRPLTASFSGCPRCHSIWLNAGVLVPVTAHWNEELLRQEGFTSVDCFWRHLNFAGWVAVKS